MFVRSRIGRPSVADENMMMEIRKELANSTTGWDFRQVMDVIQKRMGASTMKYTYAACFTNGDLYQRFRRRDLQEQHPQKRKRNLKRVQNALIVLKNRWIILV